MHFFCLHLYLKRNNAGVITNINANTETVIY